MLPWKTVNSDVWPICSDCFQTMSAVCRWSCWEQVSMAQKWEAPKDHRWKDIIHQNLWIVHPVGFANGIWSCFEIAFQCSGRYNKLFWSGILWYQMRGRAAPVDLKNSRKICFSSICQIGKAWDVGNTTNRHSHAGWRWCYVASCRSGPAQFWLLLLLLPLTLNVSGYLFIRRVNRRLLSTCMTVGFVDVLLIFKTGSLKQ